MSRTLANVRDLAPVVRKHAEQVEQERRLPEDLLAELRAAGCFRMLYADGPDLMGAGAVAPKGRAEEEDGGG